MGGPKGGTVGNSANLHAGFEPDKAMFELALDVPLGFPHFQALKRRQRGVCAAILLLPPSMFKMVTSVLWSGRDGSRWHQQCD